MKIKDSIRWGGIRFSVKTYRIEEDRIILNLQRNWGCCASKKITLAAPFNGQIDWDNLYEL